MVTLTCSNVYFSRTELNSLLINSESHRKTYSMKNLWSVEHILASQWNNNDLDCDNFLWELNVLKSDSLVSNCGGGLIEELVNRYSPHFSEVFLGIMRPFWKFSPKKRIFIDTCCDKIVVKRVHWEIEQSRRTLQNWNTSIWKSFWFWQLRELKS